MGEITAYSEAVSHTRRTFLSWLDGIRLTNPSKVFKQGFGPNEVPRTAVMSFHQYCSVTLSLGVWLSLGLELACAQGGESESRVNSCFCTCASQAMLGSQNL